MNSSMLQVLNALAHSRKFQAFAISLTIAILIPVINKVAGLELDPQVVSNLVLAAVGGGAAYGIATGIEDGQKAKAAAAVMASGDTSQVHSLLGGFGDIGITVGVQAFLNAIKGPNKKAQLRDIAARVVRETISAFSNDDEFLKKAGLR